VGRPCQPSTWHAAPLRCGPKSSLSAWPKGSMPWGRLVPQAPSRKLFFRYNSLPIGFGTKIYIRNAFSCVPLQRAPVARRTGRRRRAALARDSLRENERGWGHARVDLFGPAGSHRQATYAPVYGLAEREGGATLALCSFGPLRGTQAPSRGLGHPAAKPPARRRRGLAPCAVRKSPTFLADFLKRNQLLEISLFPEHPRSHKHPVRGTRTAKNGFGAHHRP
jgi:hypothetical protein